MSAAPIPADGTRYLLAEVSDSVTNAPTIGVVSWISLVAAGIGGLLVGVIIVLIVRSREVTRFSKDYAEAETEVLADRVLERSPLGHVVLDGEAHVLLANPRSRELGVVRAGMVDERVREVIDQVLTESVTIQVEIPAPEPLQGRRGPELVQVLVASLGEGLVVVFAADGTENVRLQSVRRDFVANVSHELKTPVAAIGLLSEAIVDAADDPAAVRRFSDRLLAESTRLGALIGELLVLSRLQGADPLPELTEVDVEDLLTEAIARTSTLAEDAGISLAMAECADLTIRGDRPMLLTALTNLITNGVNYSPPGTTVSVSAVKRNGMVEIAVTDRGIGIAPALQSRVFERFFRADPARSRSTGGTGLGLAIVKHVAANHGGRATLWSRPGVGSTFTVKLPSADDPIDNDTTTNEGAT